MNINRQNYQVWITDYYDGQLDDFQAEVLMDFLADNPDLMSEFEDYPGIFLSPESRIRFDRGELLKTPEQLTNEQVEHFSIAYCENDLGERQRQEINELRKSDPRFSKSISIYEKIRLEPDMTEYPGRSLLLKIPARRRLTGTIVTALSIAASLAILTGLYLIFDREDTPLINDSSPVVYSPEREDEAESMEKPPMLDLTEEETRYITALAETHLVATPPKPDIGRDSIRTVKRTAPLSISHIPLRQEINLRSEKMHFLLAETEPYNIVRQEDRDSTVGLSVREFLAYNFRKKILREEDPGIDHLKAWEIADAGIEGLNTLLGWNMDLERGLSQEGRLENISFTSELLKFDHKAGKKSAGL